jgi:hypothetical protein
LSFPFFIGIVSLGITAAANFIKNGIDDDDDDDDDDDGSHLVGMMFFKVIVTNGGGPIIRFGCPIGVVTRVESNGLMYIRLEPTFKYELLDLNKKKEEAQSRYQLPPDDETVQAACARLPSSEVKYVMDNVPKITLSDFQIRYMVVHNRLCNTICDNIECKVKQESRRDPFLILCQGCLCTWYCNNECRNLALVKHRLWCGQADAHHDTGDMSTFIGQIQVPDDDRTDDDNTTGIKKSSVSQESQAPQGDLAGMGASSVSTSSSILTPVQLTIGLAPMDKIILDMELKVVKNFIRQDLHAIFPKNYEVMVTTPPEPKVFVRPQEWDEKIAKEYIRRLAIPMSCDGIRFDSCTQDRRDTLMHRLREPSSDAKHTSFCSWGYDVHSITTSTSVTNQISTSEFDRLVSDCHAKDMDLIRQAEEVYAPWTLAKVLYRVQQLIKTMETAVIAGKPGKPGKPSTHHRCFVSEREVSRRRGITVPILESAVLCEWKGSNFIEYIPTVENVFQALKTLPGVTTSKSALIGKWTPSHWLESYVLIKARETPRIASIVAASTEVPPAPPTSTHLVSSSVRKSASYYSNIIDPGIIIDGLRINWQNKALIPVIPVKKGYHTFLVSEVIWAGDQKCPFSVIDSDEPCRYGNRDICIQRGNKRIVLSHTALHNIVEHDFWGGKHSPYYVNPRKLFEMFAVS